MNKEMFVRKKNMSIRERFKNVKDSNHFYYLVVFFGIFILRTLSIAGTYNIRAAKDDVGILAFPAYLAGLDWSDVVGQARYYGFAYSVLYTPFFWIFKNPVTLWKIIVYFNNIVAALSGVLGYYICVRYWGFGKRLFTALTVIASSFLCITSPYMSNEVPLYLALWVISLLLTKYYVADGKKRYLYMMLLLCACAWAYLVHTRATIFIIVAVAIMFFLNLVQKRRMNNIVLIISSVIFWFVFKGLFREFVISLLFEKLTGNLQNAELPSLNVVYLNFFTVTGMKLAFDMGMANLYTFIAKTYGLGVVVIAGMFYQIFNFRSERKTNVAFWFSFISFLICLAGLIAYWGKGLILSYDEFGNEVYYKGFSYFRYYSVFCVPAFVIALNNVEKKDIFRRKILIPMVIGILFVFLYEKHVITWRLSSSDYIDNGILSIIADNHTPSMINRELFFVLILLLVTLFILCKHRETYILCCLFLAVWVGVSNTDTILPHFVVSSTSQKVCSALQVLTDEDLEYTLYVPNANQSFRLQVFNPTKNVKVSYPNNVEEPCIVVSKKNDEKLIRMGFMQLYFDTGKYCLWTNDSTLHRIISERDDTVFAYDIQNQEE